MTDLYAAFADVAGRRILVDASKNLCDAALLAKGSTVPVYCLQVVRDPRGVVHARRILDGRPPSRPRPLTTIKTCVYWSLVHVSARTIARAYPADRFIRMRYESFADDPQGSVEAVARAVGTSPPTPELTPEQPADVPAAHGPDGQGRFEATRLLITVDDEWKHELNRVDRLLATVVTYPLLRRFGYPTWRSNGS
jgi:hypothetical protein